MLLCRWRHEWREVQLLFLHYTCRNQIRALERVDVFQSNQGLRALRRHYCPERRQLSPTDAEVGERQAPKKGLQTAANRHDFFDPIAGSASFAPESTATHTAMRSSGEI
jgi:hypothetical protein